MELCLEGAALFRICEDFGGDAATLLWVGEKLVHDIIGVEDLNLKGMQTLWGRKESDLAYGEFVQILEYVAASAGKKVVKIDRWAPSTKTCSECGCHVELSLKDRSWVCPHCGAIHDRDINAAINILELALAA